MRTSKLGFAVAALAVTGTLAFAEGKPVVGIVSISATEANNVRYINGATKAADELGWTVNVVDAAGNADQANAAIQNFAQVGAAAIIDMVFPCARLSCVSSRLIVLLKFCRIGWISREFANISEYRRKIFRFST